MRTWDSDRLDDIFDKLMNALEGYDDPMLQESEADDSTYPTWGNTAIEKACITRANRRIVFSAAVKIECALLHTEQMHQNEMHQKRVYNEHFAPNIEKQLESIAGCIGDTSQSSSGFNAMEELGDQVKQLADNIDDLRVTSLEPQSYVKPAQKRAPADPKPVPDDLVKTAAKRIRK